MAELIPVSTEADLAPAFEADLALIYKHSPSCFTSLRALRQVQRFVEAHPETPVYLIDVVRHRPLARGIADRLDVRHESPQAILLRGGAPVWNTSHSRITAETLEEQTTRPEGG